MQDDDIHNDTLSKYTIQSEGIQIILEARGIAKDTYSDQRTLLRRPHLRSDAMHLDYALYHDVAQRVAQSHPQEGVYKDLDAIYVQSITNTPIQQTRIRREDQFYQGNQQAGPSSAVYNLRYKWTQEERRIRLTTNLTGKALLAEMVRLGFSGKKPCGDTTRVSKHLLEARQAFEGYCTSDRKFRGKEWEATIELSQDVVSPQEFEKELIEEDKRRSPNNINAIESPDSAGKKQITGRYRIVEVAENNPATYVGQMKAQDKGKTLDAMEAFTKRSANRANGAVQNCDATIVQRAIDIAKANNWNTVYITWFELGVLSKEQSSAWEIDWATNLPNSKVLRAGRGTDCRQIREISPTYQRLIEESKPKFKTITIVNSLEEHFTGR